MQERQQLSLLETERRAALRQHEDELAAEAQRLDDVAKEQRLRQVESMELSYQTQLQARPLLTHTNCLASSLMLLETDFTKPTIVQHIAHDNAAMACESNCQAHCQAVLQRTAVA